VRRGVGHAPAQAGGAETALLAGEGDHAARAADGAARAQETVRQNAALQVGLQLLLDVARQRLVGGALQGPEGLQVAGQHLVEGFLLRGPQRGDVAQGQVLPLGRRQPLKHLDRWPDQRHSFTGVTPER
jgi:hypothetical protein